jgi:hypothetical protein
LLCARANQRVRQTGARPGARSSSTSRASTTASAGTRRSATSVPHTTNPDTHLLCARANKRVRQPGAPPACSLGVVSCTFDYVPGM